MPAHALDGEALRETAQGLATVLDQAAPLWRPAPFHNDPPWVVTHPHIAALLLALDDDAREVLESRPDALVASLGAHVPTVAAAAALTARIDRDAVFHPLDLPETAGRDVPGRKWQQVLHFASAVQAAAPGACIVEWCSGKGHLGRVLARDGTRAVTSIERDRHLCAAGEALARHAGLPQRFACADVLHDAAARDALTPDAQAVALHACGDLHVALLQLGVAQSVASIAIAPCCYHLAAAENWRPLSSALAGRLALTRDDLRLAVQETVTSGARVVRQTQRLAAWRLGFDALQRELRGRDEYLPCPSQPARALTEGFPAFCRRLAAHHGITLPATTDFPHFEMLGERRRRRVARLELLRHAFRRPLEVMLVLDRALYLVDHGYAVDVRPFCPRPLTPRNFLVTAERVQAAAGPVGRPADATASAGL